MGLKNKFSVENLKAVMQMIRLPNVVIIILTMFLLRYCIVIPFLYAADPSLATPLPDFLVLVAVTVLIAAGGYVINDYFDVKIDRINRPDKQIVDNLISHRGAIKLHILLNTIAILLGFWLSWRVRTLSFGFIFPFLSGLLWIYSAKYKRILFWGNFIVASLSAFVILVVWLFEFFWLRMHALVFAGVIPSIRRVTLVFLGYAIFAFLVSMVREIIKDMEDTEGDRTFGCKTLPLVAGMKFTRYIVAVIIAATMLLLANAQMILFRMCLMPAFWYFSATVQAGALILLVKLFFSRKKTDFHFLSTLCKLIMVAGILSMEVIFISL